MKLYTYWRSTATYRVRIALNLKSIPVEQIPVHLVKNTGEQHSPEFKRINPGRTVPALITSSGIKITQSMAILEYLEECFPAPPFLPKDKCQRARVRSAAQLITSDIHPVNNLRVINYLKFTLAQSDSSVPSWMHHWMKMGLSAYQDMIEPDTRFSFSDQPGLADLCLIPQLYNAHRWQLELKGLERLVEIENQCMSIDAFNMARPEAQPDAE